MPSHSLADRIEGLVHADTQVHDAGVDLTVAGVVRVEEAGRIDFGGGELTDAALDTIDPSLRAPDDEYGWWDLPPGQYLVTFNERLVGDEAVRVEPRRELVERGGSLPSVATTEFGPLPLATPSGSAETTLRLKENARVATVRSR